MMFKAAIIVSMFISLALSSSSNFSEVRYSDALERSIEFHGKITFLEDGLFIEYKDINKSLKYSADTLIIIHTKIIELKNFQIIYFTGQIIVYKLI